MNKLFEIYKNKYFKLFVCLIFLIFILRNRTEFGSIKDLGENQNKESKFKAIKKIKTVLTKLKDGQGSYTKKIYYEYEDLKEEKQKESVQGKINNHIAKKISEKERREKRLKLIEEQRQQQRDKINNFIAEYTITKNTKNAIKTDMVNCGDLVKYKMAIFINNSPISLNDRKLSCIAGINNDELSIKIIGKQLNDVFEIDNLKELREYKKKLEEARRQVYKENKIEHIKTNNYTQDINIKYRIKVIEITKGNTKIINKYCKKWKI